MSTTDFRIPRARIAGQAPDDAAWIAIEDIYDALATPYRPDRRLDELTGGQRAVYVLHWVQSEIRNGGFEQLYENSTGRFAARAPEAARAVGADAYADVLARANALFPGGDVPEAAGRRREALRAVRADHAAELDALDDEFFALLAERDVYDQMGEYVLANPEEFCTD